MRSRFAVAVGFAVFGTVTIAHAQCSAGNHCYSRPQYRTPFTSQYRQIPTGSYTGPLYSRPNPYYYARYRPQPFYAQGGAIPPGTTNSSGHHEHRYIPGAPPNPYGSGTAGPAQPNPQIEPLNVPTQPQNPYPQSGRPPSYAATGSQAQFAQSSGGNAYNAPDYAAGGSSFMSQSTAAISAGARYSYRCVVTGTRDFCPVATSTPAVSGAACTCGALNGNLE